MRAPAALDAALLAQALRSRWLVSVAHLDLLGLELPARTPTADAFSVRLRRGALAEQICCHSVHSPLLSRVRI